MTDKLVGVRRGFCGQGLLSNSEREVEGIVGTGEDGLSADLASKKNNKSKWPKRRAA